MVNILIGEASDVKAVFIGLRMAPTSNVAFDDSCPQSRSRHRSPGAPNLGGRKRKRFKDEFDYLPGFGQHGLRLTQFLG
jgi:hypothetical protein